MSSSIIIGNNNNCVSTLNNSNIIILNEQYSSSISSKSLTSAIDNSIVLNIEKGNFDQTRLVYPIFIYQFHLLTNIFIF